MYFTAVLKLQLWELMTMKQMVSLYIYNNIYRQYRYNFFFFSCFKKSVCSERELVAADASFIFL